jgi:FMN phosphatase YigB (HAD superfamily)
MRLDRRLLDMAQELAERKVKVALVTDNMDVFTQLTVPHHSLERYFPVIVNSCEYGFLKSEENGKLFDIALSKLGISGFARALLIDDSKSVRPVFEGRGGTAYLYETFERFAPWAEENLRQGI